MQGLLICGNYKILHFLQVTCIREGFRSIPLKNAYSEDYEISSLLIHMTITVEVSDAVFFNVYLLF